MNKKLTISIEKNVKKSVKEIDPDSEIILFGSRARGDSRKFSDWDFLILTSFAPDEKTKGIIRDKLLDTELESETVINSLIFSKEKWKDYQVTPLYQNIENDGMVI